MRTLILLLLIALIGVQYKLWVGDGNMVQWKLLKQRINDQKNANEKLIRRNAALEADILELKHGEQALEEQARYELGMIKENEQYYQFIQ